MWDGGDQLVAVDAIGAHISVLTSPKRLLKDYKGHLGSTKHPLVKNWTNDLKIS